ncbi:AAA family ATPase [Xanthobacter sp. 126]|uniref:AAA family ATPase n=1 Tax=Xanthobacter sp. 126 TaxID=1131814 RepID=UPI00045EC29C|nr:AAA family ATPase [Xanthobacter sp. 126]
MDPIPLDAFARRGTPPPRKSPTIFTATDLMAEQFEPVSYIVPGYVAEGCTLLAGRPKLGKSWLCLEWALAVAEGEVCLGNIRCTQGSVLYLALEDNRRRLQRRLRKLMLAGHDAPERLLLATEWPRASEGGVEEIRRWIDETYDARLVIVDVLAMFRPARTNKEQPYEADYNAIKALQSLAAETGVAIVVVHHTRKGAGDADPFEKVSGTLGLTGAADSAIILDRDGNGASLYARGRDIEEVESAVEFDTTTCRWRVMGEASEVRRSDERTHILDVLKDADEPMAPSDLAGALGWSNNNVRVMLFRMAKAGEVVKSGRKYVHPERMDLLKGARPDDEEED